MAKSNKRNTSGRYTAPEARGRITAAKPVGEQHSPEWFGWLIVQLLAFGLIVITLNYLSVLPGAVSSWYLVIGLVSLFSGFYLATRYH